MSGFIDFLNEKKDCSKVNSIEDINDQYNYEDKKGLGGSLEWSLLSCGQDASTSGYNELQRFYDQYIPEKFKGLAFGKITLEKLCECCKELSHEKRTHEEFKKCMSVKLGIVIK